MMLSLGLSLLGIAKRIMGWLADGVRWLFASWERVVIAALIASTAWFWHGRGVEARRADKMTVAVQKWETAYTLMIEANRLATLAAKQNVARVEREYQEIANEAEQDHARNLADSRAALRRFVQQNRGGAARQDNRATAPAMPGEPMRETPETILPVRLEDLEIAAENYAQLISLIDWAERIGNVETTPPPDVPD